MKKPEVKGNRKVAKTTVDDTSATAAVSSTKLAKRRVEVAHAVNKDPFVGKSVAFGVNSDVDNESISS
jgi:hypothetical protein